MTTTTPTSFICVSDMDGIHQEVFEVPLCDEDFYFATLNSVEPRFHVEECVSSPGEALDVFLLKQLVIDINDIPPQDKTPCPWPPGW